jgi:membrane-associated phospholipid phosphatase
MTELFRVPHPHPGMNTIPFAAERARIGIIVLSITVRGSLLLPVAGNPRKAEPVGSNEKNRRFPHQIWILSLLLCIAMVALAFLYFDLPVARHFYGFLGHAKSIGAGFSGLVLLSAEAIVALGLMLERILRGRLTPFREATALACLTSMCAYTINDGVLKRVFGLPSPMAVMHGSRHVFDLLGGSPTSGFPSGHMVLAGAFGGVFMRLYRGSTLPLAALLLAGAGLLVLGDWHFISDVIAGAFIGVSAGTLAGELWLVHSE